MLPSSRYMVLGGVKQARDPLQSARARIKAAGLPRLHLSSVGVQAVDGW
jgi:hypothetical protein